MKVELFSVYDMAAKGYVDPFVAPTIEYAIRTFRATCENPETNLAKYPEDYALYHVGSFDGEKGVLVPVEAHKIATAGQFAQGFGNQLDLIKEQA